MDRDKDRNRDRVTGRDLQGQKDADKEKGDRDEERGNIQYSSSHLVVS